MVWGICHARPLLAQPRTKVSARPRSSVGGGVSFSFRGTRVTDLENNTKPQLLLRSVFSRSLSLLKHHFVTNEAPNSESDSVSLGGRFLSSLPSLPPSLSHSQTLHMANLKIGIKVIENIYLKVALFHFLEPIERPVMCGTIGAYESSRARPRLINAIC